MSSRSLDNINNRRHRPGVILLVTLVLLVVLATLGYSLSSRLSTQRHRVQYMIDYSEARYGCDSALKYALSTLQDISPELIDRPNVPDFSDLFNLSEAEYDDLMAQWAAETTSELQEDFYDIYDTNDTNYINYVNDINDINDINDMNEMGGFAGLTQPKPPVIPGPYGAAWPFVAEPLEFDIGSVKVTIEIEDENAKYPVGWMLLDEKAVEREATAGFETFCEWMDANEVEIDSLKQQLGELRQIKTFKVKFKPLKRITRTTSTSSRRTRRGRRSRGRKKVARPKITEVSVAEQMAKQAEDFARLYHSSLIDTETLARPTKVNENRKESLLKYMGIWGSGRVNINTAPRHVLEAAFAFGGDAERIADEIIRRRVSEPFKDMDDLKESLYIYSEPIRKSENYITMTSTFFTIRVKAVSGVAETSAVIGIAKEGKKINKIGMISG